MVKDHGLNGTLFPFSNDQRLLAPFVYHFFGCHFDINMVARLKDKTENSKAAKSSVHKARHPHSLIPLC